VPAFAGVTLRAVAHRISVEWDDGSEGVAIGVFVPMRQTDSPLAVALGGRWFPGAHERARVEVSASDGQLRWMADPRGPDGYRVRVEASIPSQGALSTEVEPVAATCVSADVGLSPDHRGVLEGARMEPDHRRLREVVIDDLESGFLSSFATAQVAPSYLMADVGVTWTRAMAPRFMSADVLA